MVKLSLDFKFYLTNYDSEAVDKNSIMLVKVFTSRAAARTCDGLGGHGCCYFSADSDAVVSVLQECCLLNTMALLKFLEKSKKDIIFMHHTRCIFQ